MSMSKMLSPFPAPADGPAPIGKGGAILAAALMLPGLQNAHAEAVPERGEIAFKYLRYKESQTGLERVQVQAPSLSVMVPVAGAWTLEASVTTDTVSGASPRYHSAISGASVMHDQRLGADVRVTRYWHGGTVAIGAAYSNEHDYLSRAVSLQASLPSEDRNTTWLVGIGGAQDAINSVNRVATGETKTTRDVMVGVSRILTPGDIVQLNLGHVRGSGYFSDPYKLFDRRPRERRQYSALLRWNHHVPGTAAALRMGYRYYSDSFGVSAHTVTTEYGQPISHGWTMTPSLRLYSQRAATFYADPVYDIRFGPPFPVNFLSDASRFISQDQRLSAFGAITLGLKMALQLNRDWQFDVKLERYQQRSEWRVFGQDGPGLAPLRASSVMAGFARQF